MLFPFNFPVLGLKRFFSNRTGGLLRSRRLWWSISGGVAYLDLLYHSPMPTVVWIYLVVHADVSKDLQICKTLLVGRKQICPSPARALRLPLMAPCLGISNTRAGNFGIHLQYLHIL